MDILVAEDASRLWLSSFTRMTRIGARKEIVEVLKDTLPQQMFVIKLQAAIGGKIIAAERISAMKKMLPQNYTEAMLQEKGNY